jgi:hypothetical protein
MISRNAILFALGMTIVLCGCSTVPRMTISSHSSVRVPGINGGTTAIPRAHSKREIRLEFTKEF